MSKTTCCLCCALLVTTFASLSAAPKRAAKTSVSVPRVSDSRGGATGLARSANFTVWADSQVEAERIVALSERLRKEIAVHWLGEELPDGLGHATINVDFSAEDEASTWLAGSDEGRAHLMTVRTTPDRLKATLGHEIAHIVLASRFPGLPVFAQEGIASTYDDVDRIGTRNKIAEWWVKNGRFPSLFACLKQESIGHSNQQAYTTAASMTGFLLARSKDDLGGFLEFAEEGRRTGNWGRLLQERYGFETPEEFQQSWESWVRREVGTASSVHSVPKSEIAKASSALERTSSRR